LTKLSHEFGVLIFSMHLTVLDHAIAVIRPSNTTSVTKQNNSL